MRAILFALVASLIVPACSNEPARDADPCAKANANARRLAAAEPGTIERFGADPLPLERCRTLASREEVSCLAYASSWQELTSCSKRAIVPAANVADER